MPSYRELLERRVPQYLAIYLGAGWGLIEFASFLEQRYAFSPAWTDLVLFSWALLIPSVLLFTYNHGRPGSDAWTRTEKVGIPLNVVLAAIVLTSAFSGRDLGATTTMVTVTDEAGNTVERAVAKSSYRKRIAIFHFDVAGADTALAWTSIGAAMALSADLAQDLFVDIRTPPQFREKLRAAGIAPGQPVPLMLKRKIAEELHLPYFVTGSVASGIEGITVRVTTYETATGSKVRERVTTHRDLLDGIDELSVQVRQDLGLPATRPAGVQDLPVAELLSTRPDAVRALVEGQAAAERDDWAAADRAFSRAVELDPGFASAHYALYTVRVVSGNAQAAMPSLDAALQHAYRLPERMQFLVKIENFVMKQDMDKAYAVVNMMVELYPDDLTGHTLRAQLETYRDDRRGAIAALRRIVELDPQQQEIALQIGELQEATGAFDDALATYRDYATKFPSDVAAQRRLASTQQTLGRLSDARASLERALLIDPKHVQAMVDLAGLLRSTGELDAARARLEQALAEASTAEERAAAYSGLQSYHEFRGEMQLAMDALERRLAAVAEHQPPLVALSQRMGTLDTYVHAGRAADGRAVLERVKVQLTAPLDEFWRMGQLILAAELRDTTELAEAMAGVRRVMDGFGFKFMGSMVVKGEGVLHEERGDWAGALRSYQRLLEQEPKGLGANRYISRAYRMLDRPADAQRAIDAHLRTAPFSPSSNIEAARVQLQLGDTAAARAHLDRAARVLEQADAAYGPARELAELLGRLRAN
jgi:tetratricopeptide (TPR) repeat protein